MRRAQLRKAAWVLAVGVAYVYALDGCELVAGVGSLGERGASDGGGQDSTTGDGSGSGSGSSGGSDSGSSSGSDSGSSSGNDSGSGGGADSGSSSGGDSGGGDGGGCAHGTQKCSGNGVETCSSNGQWGTAVACTSSQSCFGGNCVAITSCQPGGAGMATCPGGTGTGSCCLSQEVTGGMFDRSYDGLSSGFTSIAYPATVSGFRLDAYEVTVGRFRQFASAWGSWAPTLTTGSGLHTHLNGGKGLNVTGGGYESGWDTSWNTNVLTSSSGWPPNSTNTTWTTAQGTAATESLPITGVDWYEAYAFCIWDGGFLPSEAEWNYAAAGGSDQRVYPWSPAYPPGSTTISCYDENYTTCYAGAANGVGAEPMGIGKWGQSDMAGNVWEWTLDTWDGSSPYSNPCTDCTDLASAIYRATRGGSFGLVAGYQLASHRDRAVPAGRDGSTGFRCARTP